MARRLDIAEQLRRAILAQTRKETLYAIAKGAGVNWSVIHRFINEDEDQRRDLRLETAAKLASYLKLELVEFGVQPRR